MKRIAVYLATVDEQHNNPQVRDECSACFTSSDDLFLVLSTPKRTEAYCMECAFKAALRIFTGG